MTNPGEIKIIANKVEAKLLHELESALNQKYFFLCSIFPIVKSIDK
jgi:hypothetical protein